MVADVNPDLTSLMGQVAMAMGTPSPRDDVLKLIAETTRQVIAGTDSVSVTVKHSGGPFVTAASTDDLSLRADELQYQLGEGPCVEACTGPPVIQAQRIGSDGERWPTYAPRASGELGIASQVAFRMYDGDTTYGGLNLYSRTPDAYDSEDLSVAELFAQQGAVVMGHAAAVTQMDQALATRKIIGQAIGLIMERYDVDEDRAFQFLARMSQTGNIKLRDVAQEIVTSANEKAGHLRE